MTLGVSNDAVGMYGECEQQIYKAIPGRWMVWDTGAGSRQAQCGAQPSSHRLLISLGLVGAARGMPKTKPRMVWSKVQR